MQTKTGLACALAVLVAAGAARAESLVITHSGHVLDWLNQPVSDTLVVKFALYDAPDALVPVWSSDGTWNLSGAACLLDVFDGYYVVSLGGSDAPGGQSGVCGEPLSDDVFPVDRPAWLEVRIDDVPLSPRQVINPVPVASSSRDTARLAQRLASPDGLVNAAGNPVHWSQLTGVPAGLADGTDDSVTYSAGLGLRLVGTEFAVAPGGIGTSQLADGAVTADKLGASSVTAGKIAANAVGSLQIANASVTAEKLSLAAGSLSGTVITSGTVGAGQLASGAVTTDKIAGGAVSTAQLANASVTAEKIAPGAIDFSKLVAGPGSNLNADLLDGIDSSQFLRNDRDGTLSGKLTVTGAVTTSALGSSGNVSVGSTAANPNRLFVTGGSAHFVTNSDAQPLVVSRTYKTSSHEELRVSVNDSAATLHYVNDEATNRLDFRLENTDTEANGGAGANNNLVLSLHGNGAGGSVQVHRALTVGSGATVAGGLSVTGNSSVTGNLTVSGTTTTGALTAAGNASVGGTLTATGNASVGGTLTVGSGRVALTHGAVNVISMGSAGVAAPSTADTGWKLRTWGTQFGLGIDSGTQWYSAGENHRWYTVSGSTWTERMNLSHAGLLTVGSLNTGAASATSLVVSGLAGTGTGVVMADASGQLVRQQGAWLIKDFATVLKPSTLMATTVSDVTSVMVNVSSANDRLLVNVSGYSYMSPNNDDQCVSFRVTDGVMYSEQLNSGTNGDKGDDYYVNGTLTAGTFVLTPGGTGPRTVTLQAWRCASGGKSIYLAQARLTVQVLGQ